MVWCKALRLRKGSIVQECSPRPYHNEAGQLAHQTQDVEEKVAFAFDAAPATGGVRGRSVRRAAPAPNLSPPLAAVVARVQAPAEVLERGGGPGPRVGPLPHQAAQPEPPEPHGQAAGR